MYLSYVCVFEIVLTARKGGKPDRWELFRHGAIQGLKIKWCPSFRPLQCCIIVTQHSTGPYPLCHNTKGISLQRISYLSVSGETYNLLRHRMEGLPPPPPTIVNFCFFVCLSVCVLFSVAIWQWAFLLKQLCLCVLTCYCTKISRTRRQLTKWANWTAGQDKTGQDGGLLCFACRSTVALCRELTAFLERLWRESRLTCTAAAKLFWIPNFVPFFYFESRCCCCCAATQWMSPSLLLLLINFQPVFERDTGRRRRRWGDTFTLLLYRATVSTGHTHTIRQNHSHNCIILSEAPNKIEIKIKKCSFCPTDFVRRLSTVMDTLLSKTTTTTTTTTTSRPLT